MLRRLFTVLSALSLSLCVATVVLWVWSEHAPWGRIDITRREVTELLDKDGRPFLANERCRGLLIESGSMVLYRLSMNTDPGPRTAWEFNERVVGRNLREPGQWFWTASQPDLFGAPDAYSEAGVRTALVVAALAVLPVWWCVAAVRRARRGGPGLCPDCGYDLRATPGRCPECGTPAAAR